VVNQEERDYFEDLGTDGWFNVRVDIKGIGSEGLE
jgi:hypothetical protein